MIDPDRFAADLGEFVAALQAIDTNAGPPAGPHSCWRGGDLAVYDQETRDTVENLACLIDGDAVLSIWGRAAATLWEQAPVWVHGDLAAANLLVIDGRLSAVSDFGCCAIGDPACDLVIAWTLFEGSSGRVFRDGISLDDNTWTRARGWALWKALIACRDGVRTATVGDAEHATVGVLARPRLSQISPASIDSPDVETHDARERGNRCQIVRRTPRLGRTGSPASPRWW